MTGNRILVIAGATASGKSALALQASEILNGEIVSVDSMQLYRDLPIGTAQPSIADRNAIAHHLTGIYELSERSEVFRFCQEADAAIAGIFRRGKVPVLCGGTGLYLKALLYGLDDLPGDRELRAELDAEYDSEAGEKLLHARISTLDPQAFARWKMCRRRLIRALEVFLLTGKSIIELQQGKRQTLRYDTVSFVLERDNSQLKERIAARAGKMLENGWIEETRAAVAKGLFSSPTAHQALGYRQVNDFINGRLTREELLQKIATATWQYARRQRTWFRHQHPEARIIGDDIRTICREFTANR
ncbi:MAG: tRNA (adenosine(37)-N6)-dimethylallyltransferase MiaA [Lentisphaeria bacterium]|nr:tRNA (adenosine(37)-N6)-dimethylallyltransferase MiaA [Lentisphaeria bacterium]